MSINLPRLNNIDETDNPELWKAIALNLTSELNASNTIKAEIFIQNIISPNAPIIINMIKALRAVTGYSLKQSKDIIELILAGNNQQIEISPHADMSVLIKNGIHVRVL